MKKTVGEYQRLAGKSLWEGPDHLLYIETSGFVFTFRETYKRIDYAKIQSISYGRTWSYFWSSVWMGLILGLLVWGLLANLETPAAAIIFGSLGAIVLIALIIHLVRGPTCLCKLQTAVQVLRLKPLNRIRPTLRFVARLTQLALQHQGGQMPDVQAIAAAQTTEQAPPPPSAAVKVAFPGSKLVTFALLTLVVSGAMIMAEPFIDQFGFFFAAGLMSLLSHVLVLISLGRNFRYRLPTPLKISLWGGTANVGLSFLTGYAVLIMASFKSTQASMQAGRGFDGGFRSNFDIWTWMSSATMAELGFLGWMIVLNGALAVFCGIIGLPAALNPPGQKAAPTTPPPLATDNPEGP